ncbi:hypothetical protein AAVH_08900, partial [Aphelenchoides avenae]
VNIFFVLGIQPSWTSMFYVMTAYMLYGFQLALTVIAVWVIVVKTKHSVLFHGQQTAARRHELLRALYFAVGPSLIQLPFAVNLVLFQILRARVDDFSEANV